MTQPDVTIHEVGPRDGLQNEPGLIPPDDKLALIAALADAGLRRIEVGSFVSPRWVPQMADTDVVLAGLPKLADVQYDVLVPNQRGWDNFVQSGLRSDTGISVFISASEGFSQSNLNCSIAQSVANLAPVVVAAQKAGVPIRGYVSCVTDCPFDGEIAPKAVAQAVQMLRDLAAMPISLGDTIGKGTPERVEQMFDAVLADVPADELAGHFHDTGGLALLNVEAALAKGLRAFDSAVGGLGGCPYAPGAPGNLATESLVMRLEQLGYQTGVNSARLNIATNIAKEMRDGSRKG